MRWTHPLDEILASRAKVRLLRSLHSADQPLSGRAAARATGLSHTAALRALDELYAQNVLSLAAGAGGMRFRLNHDHVLVSDGLVPLLMLEQALDDRLAEFILERAPGALSIVLFGSSALGDDSETSDLDVFVVVPDDTESEHVFEELAGSEAGSRFGKRLGPVVWTVSRLRRAHRSGDRLLASILENGRVLAGDAPLAVVHGAHASAAG